MNNAKNLTKTLLYEGLIPGLVFINWEHRKDFETAFRT